MGDDLHHHPNSSNLATPCLKKGNKFAGHLAEFCGYCTVGRRDDYRLLPELYYLATMPQGRWHNSLVVSLQRIETGSLTRELPQFLIGCQKGVQTGRQIHRSHEN